MANIMHDSSFDLLSLVADVSSYVHGWLAGQDTFKRMGLENAL